MPVRTYLAQSPGQFNPALFDAPVQATSAPRNCFASRMEPAWQIGRCAGKTALTVDLFPKAARDGGEAAARAQSLAHEERAKR